MSAEQQAWNFLREGRVPPRSHGRAKRWLRFNFVGVIGFVLQLGVLAMLKSAGAHYLVATAGGVEAAVLHNFIWHELYTWRDRRSGTWMEMLRRLAAFHFSNGLFSIAGNLLLMRILVGRLGWDYLAANLVTVMACSVVNFFASDRFVFEPQMWHGASNGE